MVNLHIVPIVPKMGGHLTILYATGHYTPHWSKDHSAKMKPGIEDFWGHGEPTRHFNNLSCHAH